jgi:hypothetical protein
MKCTALATSALITSLFALPAAAVDFSVDSVSIEGGYSSNDDGNVGMGRVGLQWDWGVKWFQTGSWFLGGYWDLAAGYWNSDVSDIGDFSITPVFRFQSNATSGFSPYVELAVGAHMLTEKTITGTRLFSTSFQFGDHLAAGFRFGDKAQYDMSYHYQHLSNASIEQPNPGINFHQLRLQYHF